MDNYRLYITIVEQGSFSKAAEKLGITQPTVSKQVDRLEEKLDSQLFKRSTRKLILTAAGERYYERAREIDALIKATEHEVRHISSTDESILRISTSPALATHILPPVPSFYHRPKSIQDIIDQTIGKIFDYMDIRHDLFQRWGEDASTGQRIHPLTRVVA